MSTAKVILPDWEYVALNGREVFVVYDSDIYQKKGVELALKRLYKLLRYKGAIPHLVQWTEEYRHTKVGVDDFFAQGHTLEELLAMVPPGGPLPQTPPHRQRAAADGATPPLPIIHISTDVEDVVDKATLALLALPQAPRLYQRARALCVIARHGTPPKWLRRQADTPAHSERQSGASLGTPDAGRRLGKMARTQGGVAAGSAAALGCRRPARPHGLALSALRGPRV